MNLLKIFSVLLIVCTSTSTKQSAQKTLEAFKSLTNSTFYNVLKGLADGPIQIMDDVQFSFMPEIKELLSGTLTITNLKLSGLKKAELIEASAEIDEFWFAIKVLVPNLGIHASYEGDFAILKFLPFSGKGNVNIIIENLEIFIRNRGVIAFYYMDFKIDTQLGNIRVDLTELNTDEEHLRNVSAALTTLISTYIPFVLNEYHHEVSAALSPIIQDFLNTPFRGHPGRFNPFLFDSLKINKAELLQYASQQEEIVREALRQIDAEL